MLSRSGSESAASLAVVLDNVDTVSRDLLVVLVENMCGLDDDSYVLEVIWERNTAVVTFSRPAGRRRHRTGSLAVRCVQRHVQTGVKF